MDNYYIIVFNNTHNAIEGEKVLKSEGLSITIMPTPSQITQSCGISIRLKEEDVKHVKEVINDNRIKVKNIYRREEGNFISIL